MMMLVLHKRGALKVKGIYFFDKEACFATTSLIAASACNYGLTSLFHYG
jgi:hypothetical protein